MNTCKFAHYVKYWDACVSTLHEQFRSLCVLFFISCRILELPFLHFGCMFLLNGFAFLLGACAVSSVVPTHQVSTVSGRTITLTVVRVPAWLLVQFAEKTSWRKSCCCSVSTVIGGCQAFRITTAQTKCKVNCFFLFSFVG